MQSMKMLLFNRILFLSFFWICGVIAQGYLPPELQRCKVSDDECHTIQAQNYLRHYKNGIPEQNVPGVEPLDIGTLRAQIGEANSPIQLNLLLTNTSIHHFGDSVVKSLKIQATLTDLSKPVTTIMILSSPLLEVIANYKLKGKFLVLPINSKGEVNVKLRQVNITMHNELLPEKRADGLYYLKIIGAKMIVDVGGGSFDMTNLFEDPTLNESTLKVFNDEWKTFEKELAPKITEAATQATRQILQKLFDIIPFDYSDINK